MKIKAGIIGLGRIGSQWDKGMIYCHPQTHVGAILQSDNLELKAVCDSSAINRAKFVADWNLHLPIYGSVSEMLEAESFDVISVAVPADSHFSVLSEVLKSKPKMVFCEKPFCKTVSEAEIISNLSKEMSVVLSVNYHRRWDEKIRKVKAWTDEMGPPRHVSVLYKKGLLNYGSHIANLLLFLFGPVESVLSDALSEGQKNAEDPSISSILNFRSGLKVVVKGLDDVDYELCDIDIFYPNTKLHIEMGGYIIDMYKAVNNLYFENYINLDRCDGVFSKGPVSGLNAAYKEIENCLLRGTPCDVNAASSAIETLKVLEAMRVSAESNKSIYL